jgi:putative ABC transport system ATP-binding protein
MERPVTPQVSLRGVGKTFPAGRTTAALHALGPIDLELRHGEFFAVVGPSGCGKSTLLTLLGGLDQPSTGTILLLGRDVRTLSDRALTRLRLEQLGFVFQRFHLLPVLTARENIELPMAERGVSRAERHVRATELLEYVGLPQRAAHRATQLSGGEMQRIAIARALANRPAVLLADEPTGELDAATGREILALFRRLHAAGLTLVVVTHDDRLTADASRVVHMLDGKIVG